MAMHIQLPDGLLAFMRSRRGMIVTGLLGIFISTIILLPHAISYVMRDWLNNNGADQTHVEDVNFNLFTGKLEFINLRITVANDYTLQLQNAWVDADWLPLLSKTFYIKELYVQDTDITIEQSADGNMHVGGVRLTHDNTTEKTPDATITESTATPWGFGLEILNILNTSVNYRQPDLNLKLKIDKATLTGLHTLRIEPAHVALAGTLDGTPLSIDAKLAPFAKQPNIDAKLHLKALPLTDFKQLARAYIGVESGTLGLDIQLRARHDTNTGLELDESGRIMLTDLALLKSEGMARSGGLNWQGTLNTTLDTQNKLTKLNVAGAIEGNNVTVVNQQNNNTLLGLKSLVVDEFHLTLEQLDINEIKIATLVANLDRNAEGAMVFPSLQTAANEAASASTESVTEAPTKDASTPFAVRIGRINIMSDSTLNFTDKSTTPVFESVVTLNQVDITSLDSRKPEADMHITLDGRIGKFSSLKASGTARPFADNLALNITADIKAMEMPPLSAYTSSILGHYLLNGQLNTNIKVAIKNDLIDGQSKLHISNLEVKELTPEEKKKIHTTASSPLSLGLSMLRDRHNNIELDLPFNGNTNDPKFDISNAINQAIGKAISTAALTYLKFSLQPFGALIALASITGDINNGVQLQPVLFNPASPELTPEAVQYKQKIASILTSRPQLRIKVCGIASSRDRQHLIDEQLRTLKEKQAKEESTPQNRQPAKTPTVPDSTLLEIAQQRADNLKAALINDHKIEADRLFSCLPMIDTKPDTDPRVEIGI